MSQVSNRHNVVLFISGESKPLGGQRLSKVGYKKTDKVKNPLPSICVSVPRIASEDITSHLEALMPQITEMLSGVQDKIVRNLYETSNGTLSSVSDEEISVLSCIGYLESESAGGRLTKELLSVWFTQYVEDNLSVVIAEKLNFTLETPEQVAVVSGHVDTYKEIIMSLAGGKTVLPSDQISGVRRVLEVCSVDDEISTKLTRRLDEMEKKILENRKVLAL